MCLLTSNYRRGCRFDDDGTQSKSQILSVDSSSYPPALKLLTFTKKKDSWNRMRDGHKPPKYVDRTKDTNVSNDGSPSKAPSQKKDPIPEIDLIQAFSPVYKCQKNVEVLKKAVQDIMTGL